MLCFSIASCNKAGVGKDDSAAALIKHRGLIIIVSDLFEEPEWSEYCVGYVLMDTVAPFDVALTEYLHKGELLG